MQGQTVTQTQQSYSSSSSVQQMSYSSTQGTRSQSASQSSQAAHRSISNNARPAGNFALTRGPSGADLADGVLRDLEDGLVKSSAYIQEQHRAVDGPDGKQEWHEVRRGGDPDTFNLEQQVQHMIPANLQQEQQRSVQQQQRSVQQSSQQSSQQNTSQYQQLSKVQSNVYGNTGERITQQQHQQQHQQQQQQQLPEQEEDRPSSRLKQNIDELDTLLYDLNNARNLSPDGQADYGNSPQQPLLDSDDYDETVGTTGHVKRTANAFEHYTAQTYSKPPSPSPRRKPSPTVVRKTPPTSPTRMNTNTSSYQQQTQTNTSYYQQNQQQQQNTTTSSYHRQEERPTSPFMHTNM